MSFLDFHLELSWRNLFKWILLRIVSLLYSGLIRIWLAAYRTGLKTAWTAGKPIISVGNITIGGTGKTPMVDWLLSCLAEQNLTPAVLTRGYKAQRSDKLQILNRQTADEGNFRQFGDEPWLIFQNHPDISLYVSADRVKSARRAQTDADILLLDDGMQHLRLKRDLEIVMIDTVSGFGNGQLIPLGPLREPLGSLRRADAVIYTKTNLADSKPLQKRIATYLRPNTRQFNSKYLPEQLIPGDDSEPLSPDILKRKSCLLFSGIGNPTGFFKTVQSTGAVILDHLVFDDHQTYDAETRMNIGHFADEQQADFLICTEKDWVKLEPFKDQLPKMYRLKMTLRIDPEFLPFLSDWLAVQG